MAIDQAYLTSIGITDGDLATKIISEHDSDVSGLKLNRDQLKTEKLTVEEKLKLYHDIDPAEYAAMKLKISEAGDKKLADNGEIEKLLEKQRVTHSAELGTVQETANALNAQLSDMVVSNAISQSIAEHDGNPHILPALLRPFIRAIDKDGVRVLQVVDEAGTPREKDGKALTVADRVIEMKADENYHGAFKASGLSGSGAQYSKSKTGVVGDTSKMSPQQKMASSRPAAQ